MSASNNNACSIFTPMDINTMIVEEFDVTRIHPQIKETVLEILDKTIVERHGEEWREYEPLAYKMVCYSKTAAGEKTMGQQSVNLVKAIWGEESARLHYSIWYLTLQNKKTGEVMVTDIVRTQAKRYNNIRTDLCDLA